jgi:hypothetical protein
MRGLGTVNASAMVGDNNGVYARLKNENQAIALSMRVSLYSIIAVSNASKAHLSEVVELILREIYNWFAFSLPRQKAYRDVFQVINSW